MYRSQVDRIKREISTVEAKATDERSKANRERGEALRIRNSITSSSSPTTVRSKLIDIQRREERAVGHDKQAVRYGEEITRKTQQLRSAEASLRTAEDQQRRKDDSEQKRRREGELQHIERLEAARRTVQTRTPAFRGMLSPLPVQERSPDEYEYDVCLSFAGEQRGYVDLVANGLKGRNLRVFYDDDEKIKLWGKNLIEHFDYVYRQGSRYCVMFISAEYAAKPWTRQERRSALARALVEVGEYILPARFDDTDLPGLPPTVAYLDLREIAPATLVDAIVEKLAVANADSP
jgi:hypothetical protein